MLAWVRSSKTTQHWLLIVGVDGTGTPLLNDPWKGSKGTAFTASAGVGPYTQIVQLLAANVVGIGGADLPEPGSGIGDPAEGGHDGPFGISVYTPEGKDSLASEIGVISETGGGCEQGTGSPRPFAACLLLLLLLSSMLVARVQMFVLYGKRKWNIR